MLEEFSDGLSQARQTIRAFLLLQKGENEMIAKLTAYETGQYLAAALINLESYGATERQAIFDAACAVYQPRGTIAGDR